MSWRPSRYRRTAHAALIRSLSLLIRRMSPLNDNAIFRVVEFGCEAVTCRNELAQCERAWDATMAVEASSDLHEFVRASADMAVLRSPNARALMLPANTAGGCPHVP